MNINDIKIEFDSKDGCGTIGEYGLHDNFFNALAVIGDKEYYFQCCASDLPIDQTDCGHDWGICAEVNQELADKIGYDGILELLERAGAFDTKVECSHCPTVFEYADLPEATRKKICESETGTLEDCPACGN